MAKQQVNANTRTAPRWAGDFLAPDKLIPGGAKLDAAQFLAPDGVRVVVSGAAAAGATSVPVTALSGPIPAGTVLDFGGDEFARLTAAAAAGAVALAVAPLPTALEGGEVATYAGVLPKAVPSGTRVGRTLAERDAGTPYGAAVDTDDEIYLVAFDVPDAANNNDVELARHHIVVKENYLPGWAAETAAMKAKVRALYQCQRGVD
jgi:hypothetical protein